ncbi:MAG: ABC transporter permease subunit [Planctomycetes bacterium]|nr:ABC transporter permease subunit [Planctomycetota bacterium]
MSRPLVIAAFFLFALAALAPIAAMLPRVESSDLATLVHASHWQLLGSTLLLGTATAAIALVVGLPFGLLVARSDVPLARAARMLGIVPLCLPPMLYAMVYTAISDLRGAGASILILAIGTFPIVAVFTARAAERIDGRLEEAALLVGGPRAALIVDLRLVFPAALCGACFAFVFAIHDFAVPDYVAFVGPKFNVYAAEIFASWRVDSRPGLAVAKSLPLVALSLAVLIPALRLNRAHAATTLQSGFRTGARIALGSWRWPALLFVFAVLFVSVFLPVGRLLWESGGGASGFGLARMSGAFGRALELSRVNLQQSFLWSLGAAAAVVPVALVAGHALARARWLEPFVILPLAVPAILFGIGEIVLWNREWCASFYDGPGLVVMLFAGRFACFAILAVSGAAKNLDRTLEEAAELAGARPARRLASIVAPALRSALIGGFVLVFVLSMRELDAAILVPTANQTAIFRVYQQVHFGRDDFVAALALLVVCLILLPGILWTAFGGRRLEVLP